MRGAATKLASGRPGSSGRTMPEFARADAEVKAGVASRRLFVPPPTSCAGAPRAEFTIAGPADHGIDALVNRFGIESPGLIPSPAIARHAAAPLAT